MSCALSLETVHTGLELSCYFLKCVKRSEVTRLTTAQNISKVHKRKKKNFFPFEKSLGVFSDSSGENVYKQLYPETFFPKSPLKGVP